MFLCLDISLRTALTFLLSFLVCCDNEEAAVIHWQLHNLLSVATQDGKKDKRKRWKEMRKSVFPDKLSPAFIHRAWFIVSVFSFSLILSSTRPITAPTPPLRLSPLSLHTELLGCEMWKTAACMAIHYLVKLPWASLKPQAGTERNSGGREGDRKRYIEETQFIQWRVQQVNRLPKRRQTAETTHTPHEKLIGSMIGGGLYFQMFNA